MIRITTLKIKQYFNWLILLLAIFLISGFSLANFTISSAASSADGVQVSPLRSDVTIKAGQSQVIDMYVTNITSVPETLSGVVNDFVANSNETGQPSILIGKNIHEKHGLKKFAVPIPNFTLQAGQQKEIPITLKIPSNTPGGGYYGVVRFGPASIGGKNTTVSLSGSVGSIILLTVPGKIKQQLSIASFDVSNGTPSNFFTSNQHINAVVRFQNEGNIQVAPFGKVLLKTSSNKIISVYNVNNVTPPGNVLPNSIRRFFIPLKKVSSFGIYTVEGNFGYGSSGQTLSASTTFYVIPLTLIMIIIIFIILVIFFIFGFPKILNAYKERVIRQSRRQ